MVYFIIIILLTRCTKLLILTIIKKSKTSVPGYLNGFPNFRLKMITIPFTFWRYKQDFSSSIIAFERPRKVYTNVNQTELA